jgi:hypothetical protein
MHILIIKEKWKKKKILTKTGGLAQVIECLPGKYEPLSSNPSNTKKERSKD